MKENKKQIKDDDFSIYSGLTNLTEKLLIESKDEQQLELEKEIVQCLKEFGFSPNKLKFGLDF